MMSDRAKTAALEAWARKTNQADVVNLADILYRTTTLTEQEETVIFNMLFSRLLELDDFSCRSVGKIVERNTKK